MTTQYSWPGVYIDELTGPSVIAGVGTSTTAFIGPTQLGPVDTPTRVTSFDEYCQRFGGSSPSRLPYFDALGSPFYMGFAVEGFFINGGTEAYIVRTQGTGGAVALPVARKDGQQAFTITTQQSGAQPGQPTTITIARSASRTLTADAKKGDSSLALDSTDGIFPGGWLSIAGASPEVVKIKAVGSSNQITTVTALASKHSQGDPATIAHGVALGTATITAVNGGVLSLDDSTPFSVGDSVTVDRQASTSITVIQGDDVTVADATINGLAKGKKLSIADIAQGTTRLRLEEANGIYPGSLLAITDTSSASQPVLVADVRAGGIISVDPSFGLKSVVALDPTAAEVPLAISQDFRMVVTPPIGSDERFERLSLNPLHPRYVLGAGVISSQSISLGAPGPPPAPPKSPGDLDVNDMAAIALPPGTDENPVALDASAYRDALNALLNVQDVNLVCAPDAAAVGPFDGGEWLAIQLAVIDHCVNAKDRFAILDSRPGLAPSGAGSADAQVQQLRADNGFAAMYYPWLMRDDPRSTGPVTRPLYIPPCGHVAGLYARNDYVEGVHTAPANADLMGVLGLEQKLSDRQQGPLNLDGANVLRIFPGNGQVMVWGARTTVDPTITDWLYVNVRRLMIYIEQSIQRGIRWAVFKSNDQALWQALKRTIGDFLTSVWQDGGLFGDTADKAFQIRIDETLNPPASRALGQLFIEIKVAPVRPAEFIVVRIGLWDGGSTLVEAS